jgi:hypothetical protein
VAGELEECQTEKLDIYTKIKPALWMLVNTTIFVPTLDDLELMLIDSTNMMDEMLNTFCTADPGVSLSTLPHSACSPPLFLILFLPPLLLLLFLPLFPLLLPYFSSSSPSSYSIPPSLLTSRSPGLTLWTALTASGRSTRRRETT